MVGEAGGNHTWPDGWMWEVLALPRIGQRGCEPLGWRSTRVMMDLDRVALAGRCGTPGRAAGPPQPASALTVSSLL